MPETRPSQSDKRWVARQAAGGAISAVAKHITITFVIPLGLSFVTGLLGYIQDLPWMYVLVGTGLMFGSVTTGLVRFDDWLDRRRVKEKLGFVLVRVGRSLKVPGIFLGVQLTSHASVPVEVEFKEVRTSSTTEYQPRNPLTEHVS